MEIYKLAHSGKDLDDAVAGRFTTEVLNVAENGSYIPGEGVDGFSQVDVDVQPPLGELTITENGEYEPSDEIYGFSKIVANVTAGLVETGEITTTTFHNNSRPLTIPVAAKHSHILLVPAGKMSEFKATYANKYQYGFYAEENYGYIGFSIGSVTDAGARGVGSAYWQDETQTVFRADFADNEIVVYPENYAAFGVEGATFKWFAW